MRLFRFVGLAACAAAIMASTAIGTASWAQTVQRAVVYPSRAFEPLFGTSRSTYFMGWPGAGSANPSVLAVDLTLPLDYVPNTRARLDIMLALQITNTTCRAIIGIYNVTRRRAAKRPFSSGNVGVSAVDGRLTVSMSRDQVAGKSFYISPARTGDFVDMLPGDTVSLGLFRVPGDSRDTCDNSLLIVSAQFVYTSSR
jgi:hypothetical protein